MLRDRDQYRSAERVVKTLERRIRVGVATDHDRARARAGAEELAAYEWADRNMVPMSEHLRLELAAVTHRGEPLAADAPVPGCGCAECIGDDDEEVVVLDIHRGRRDDLPVEIARNVPITEVAERLGIRHRRGWGRCPFHEDRDPSLHINAKKGAAFCNPCGRSWDGIALVMDYLNIEFHEAVKEIAAWTGWRGAA